MKTIEVTKENLFDAFMAWNKDVNDNPQDYKDSENIEEKSKGQADKLFDLLAKK